MKVKLEFFERKQRRLGNRIVKRVCGYVRYVRDRYTDLVCDVRNRYTDLVCDVGDIYTQYYVCDVGDIYTVLCARCAQ